MWQRVRINFVWFLYVRKYHYRDEICDVFVTIVSFEKYWYVPIHNPIDKTGLQKFSLRKFNYFLPLIIRNLPLHAIRYNEMNELDEMYPTTSWVWFTEVLKRQKYKTCIFESSPLFFQPIDLLHTPWCSTLRNI